MSSSKSRKRRKRRERRPKAEVDRVVADQEVEATAPAAKPKPRPSPRDDAPPPPWGTFPLVELSVLAGIILLILGFFFVSGSRGPILIAAGLALGSIGGLEISIREHFAGYRSHTVLLAGVPALITLGLLFYLAPEGLPQVARAAIGVAVFGVAALLLTRIFSNRSGGLRYKFSSPRRRR